MYIRIIAVGKTKDSYLSEGLAEYQKRIGSFAKIDWQIIEDEKKKKSLDKNEIIKKESERLKKLLKKDEIVFILDEKGVNLTSLEFAKMIDKTNKIGKLTFVIGGAYGLSPDILKSANSTVVSLSKLTFTHQLTRLVLLEQIYRALTIINHKEYHY